MVEHGGGGCLCAVWVCECELDAGREPRREGVSTDKGGSGKARNMGRKKRGAVPVSRGRIGGERRAKGDLFIDDGAVWGMITRLEGEGEQDLNVNEFERKVGNDCTDCNGFEEGNLKKGTVPARLLRVCILWVNMCCTWVFDARRDCDCASTRLHFDDLGLWQILDVHLATALRPLRE